MYAPCHIGLNSSHFTLTRLILIAVVLITPLLSGSGSRVKLFFHSKRYKSQVFIEAKENTVLFCNNQDCVASHDEPDHFASLNFVSWQEYTNLGFPIVTSNKYEQMHSLNGFHNFVVDTHSKKDHSMLCDSKDLFAKTNKQCKGLSFKGRLSPKLVESERPWTASLSVLSVSVDMTVLKQSAPFTFRHTPEYKLALSPLDIVIQLTITGWSFCNLGSVECPVQLEASDSTHLVFTLDFKLDNFRPRLTGETNHYKKYSLGDGACLFVGKFYYRTHPTQFYNPTTPEYQNDAIPPAFEGVQFLVNGGIFPQLKNESKPVWLKQPPGFPTTDFSSKFAFFMEQTKSLYDETMFEIVYRPPSLGSKLPNGC